VRLLRGRLAAISVAASFRAGAWVGATIGLVIGAVLGALLAWFAGTALEWQRSLAFTLGVARALLPLGEQVAALRWLSSTWYVVIPAAALLVAAFTGLVGGIIGALMAAAYNRSPRHAAVVVELPDEVTEAGPGGAPSLPPPDAVIFDLDGTLVDTVPARIDAWEAVFAERGIPATAEELAPLIGIDGRRLARDVAEAAGTPLAAGDDEIIDHRAGQLFDERNRSPRPLPGAREALERLSQDGVTWAIATSSRAEQVASSVGALQLDDRPRIVDGSRVEHAKPAPDLLLLAAEELGVAPERCWYVGDSTWDMRAAVAAGMLAVGVLAGAAVDAGALRGAGAAVVVETLDELPQPG
jgi:HAD superfamily hydrolase (TIGR01509 family)